MPPRLVAILAQDLIWADRLARAVRAAGAEPVRAHAAAEVGLAIDGADLAIVDLVALAYDPIAAIERFRSDGARVLGLGPHDDHALRKRAIAAGAERVLAYRKLFEDGPATLRRWLGEGDGDRPDAQPRRDVPGNGDGTDAEPRPDVASEARAGADAQPRPDVASEAPAGERR